MIEWLFWGALILIVLFVLKMKHMRHRVYVIVLLLVLIFSYMTISGVIKKNNLNVTSVSGMVTAGKVYFNWLGQVFGNVKNIGGDAVKMDWAGNTSVG